MTKKPPATKLTVVAPVDAPKPDAPKPDAPKPAPDAPKPGADAAKADDDERGEAGSRVVALEGRTPSVAAAVQEDRDKRFSYLATYRIADKKFIRLADENVRDVSAPEKGRWRRWHDRRGYEPTAALEGRNYQDLHAIDIQTGERKAAAKRVVGPTTGRRTDRSCCTTTRDTSMSSTLRRVRR